MAGMTAAVCLLTFSSCNDFLEILPMDKVVLENYWTKKEDVTSVMFSCYEALQSADNINRMGVWGELRSDNIVAGTGVSWQMNDILKENLLPNNPYCSWASMYSVINRCNTVIHYAPEVCQKDPNYTEAEMKANVAEATTLRTLCYFYLMRAFRDVPYITQPSIDDDQSFAVAATPFDELLGYLIADLQGVVGDAVRRYYTDESPSEYVNSSRITRWAVYSLLADLCLWKGDYVQASAYCDKVIEYKQQQYAERKQREGNLTDMQLFNDYPLILEKPTGTTLSGNAFTEIFGRGNSFESIFELRYENGYTAVTNTYVSQYYGSLTTGGQFGAPVFIFKGVADGTNRETPYKKTDCRAYENALNNSSRYRIAKYVYPSVTMNMNNISSESSLNRVFGVTSERIYSSWIIYRLTEVMLIKAEAELLQGPAHFETAFKLIDAVNRRANNIVTETSSDALKFADYSNDQLAMENLLFEERQREFIYEGKRWFDLVRMARRDGNTKRAVALISRKYEDNVSAIRIKLADPNIFYFPYAKDELRVNPLLHQNPAYTNGEDSELSR